MTKELKLAPQMREAVITCRAATEEGADDEFELSFSSEEPYKRWWGVEILGHEKGEVDLTWMSSGRAPLLVDHDTRVDSQVGVVTKAWLEKGRGKALVRFGKNARSQEIMARVKAGELGNVSVGYRIEEMQLVKTEKNGPETYRVTKWKPHESSIVTIPADPSVGVGRSDGPNEIAVRIIETPARKSNMDKDTPQIPVAAAAAAAALSAPAAVTQQSRSPDDILKDERTRISEIEKIGSRFNRADLASKHIAAGTSAESFRGVMLDVVGEATVSERNMNANSLGLSTKEAKRFSFTRLIAAAMDPSPNGALKEAAALELEVCAAEAKRAFKSNRNMRGNQFSIPLDVLRQPFVAQHRDLNVGTTTAGGNLVQTDLMASDFISLLRNRMMVARMGARVMSGLDGNVAIPRQSGGGTFYWVAESGAPTEAQQTVDQVTLSPKTGGAFTDFSRRLMLQSSIDAEAFVRDDLLNIIALGVDLAALHGTGSSNQPTGLAGQTGVNVVALGTNGAAPTWANIVAMETEVSTDNADIGNLGYLTNAKVRGKLKGTEKASSTGQFVWENGTDGFGMLNGYRAGVSNQVSSALTKGSASGVCSGIFFGNWADLIIGQWSGIDILVDPYTGSTSGTVRVVGMQDVDIAVRHGESFSYIADALTI